MFSKRDFAKIDYSDTLLAHSSCARGRGDPSRHRQLERVTVVNRDPPPAYLARVQHAFGAESDRLRVFNNGFVEFVRPPARRLGARSIRTTVEPSRRREKSSWGFAELRSDLVGTVVIDPNVLRQRLGRPFDRAFAQAQNSADSCEARSVAPNLQELTFGKELGPLR